MDGKKVQLSKSGGGQRGPCEIRSLPSREGAHEYEMLLDEGHYRCPHCRRANTAGKNASLTRMR
jgi:hypothetical protein